MAYAYAGICGAVGLFLLVLGRKSREFYVAGGLFLLFGMSWLGMALFPALLERGWLSLLVRLAQGLNLVALVLFVARHRRKTPPASGHQTDDPGIQ